MITKLLTAALFALAIAAPASATQPGVAPATGEAHVLPPLSYRILKSGDSAKGHPTRQDDVTVRYAGRFTDGKPFDSSAKSPGGVTTFQLGRLIPGWVIALQLMRPGDQWELTVPPEMAYGEKGAGGVIPPRATLIFDVELVSFKPHVDAPATH